MSLDLADKSLHLLPEWFRKTTRIAGSVWRAAPATPLGRNFSCSSFGPTMTF